MREGKGLMNIATLNYFPDQGVVLSLINQDKENR